MALVRWPTDPPGKKPSHTISWGQHQANLKPKPAAPAAPAGPQPLPVDSLYDDDVAGLLRRRTSDETAIAGERERGRREYGFTEDETTGALAFDPNNPFSRASLLKRNYDISRARTGNQMASGGQLYAGAYQTAQDSVNRGQLGAEDTLQKSLTQFLAGNTARRTQAGTDYDLGVSEAAGRRTARALDNPLYSPTAAAPAAGAIGAPATSTRKPSALQGNTLTAAPGLRGVTKKKKGKTVTYTASVKGP